MTFTDGLDTEVAGHRLRHDRTADGLRIHVAGHGLYAQLTADSLEAYIAAHSLDLGVALDLAVDDEIA